MPGIHTPIPGNILTQIEESLLTDEGRAEAIRNIRKRLDQAYVDRLDGKITEQFWESKSAECQQEEQTLLASLRELEQAEKPERALDRFRILELANKAHSVYVTQTPDGKSEIAANGGGRNKCLSHLQKALRCDLRTG
jgi:hypothetical protein